LGDGSIEKYGRYAEIHSRKQEDYLLWKKMILDKEFEVRFHHRNCLSQSEITIKSNPLLKEIRKDVYIDGKKAKINKNFLDKIDKQAIVVWYFDDGHYSLGKRSVVIATNCFRLEDQERLQKLLKNKFDLNFRIQICRKKGREDQYMLVNYGEDAISFLRFIRKNAKFIPKSMIYKLGDVDERNKRIIADKRQEIKERQKEQYQNNRENKLNQMKEYYSKNSKIIKKKTSIYRNENRNKIREYFRNKYWENPEQHREKSKYYREIRKI
jgi:hypothetical protein